MADIVEHMTHLIQMADQVAKAADNAIYQRRECLEIKSKTEKLARLLSKAARYNSDLYERPTRRINDDTEQVLDKSLTLVRKCHAKRLFRVFTIRKPPQFPWAVFHEAVKKLEYSIGNMAWLIQFTAPINEREYVPYGLPPIAAHELMLCLIWEEIGKLGSGSLAERVEAAARLVNLAWEDDHWQNLVIEEGGIPPLLKLAEEGWFEKLECFHPRQWPQLHDLLRTHVWAI